jgi:hypothetical protein
MPQSVPLKANEQQPPKEKNNMSNSTLGRKPGNDMKKNASVAKMGDSPAAWQKADKGLGFNGQDNDSFSRPNNYPGRVFGNQHTGTWNDDNGGRGTQERQMPNKKGNISDVGARPRRAPATAGASANPVQSGARKWEPSKGQNFRGNPDSIQDRQMYNRVGNKD